MGKTALGSTTSTTNTSSSKNTSTFSTATTATASSCSSSSSHNPSPSTNQYLTDLNFDQEGHNLLSLLNLEGEKNSSSSSSRSNAFDPIYRHPKTGSIIYVGNQSVAKDRKLLDKLGIKRVVNCTDSMPNYHDGKYEAVKPVGTLQKLANTLKPKPSSSSLEPLVYLRFAVSFWHRHIVTPSNPKTFLAFLQPLLSFCDASLSNGDNVLVHCLAGAHRAGTTGCLLLMRYTNVNDVELAIRMAKEARPIIDPIGSLPQFLSVYSELIEEGLVKRSDV